MSLVTRISKRKCSMICKNSKFLRDELQELESIVGPVHRETKNLTDRMTPRALFTKKHKELVKEGEKSMKETARRKPKVPKACAAPFPSSFSAAHLDSTKEGFPTHTTCKFGCK
ncbi:unnamed protein product [Prunus armeniaca]|uniref:Uncharacterized protein n=1 Tax=Prunus armeniaca TaxID=36596 RepID=A0A6J5UDP4_PRUAR|nr:unnamed protein product [Prunus armeniaca]